MTRRSIVVGTAGHIDHGKTALVRALTGTDTDRLKEEQRRGITIELGFAYLDVGDFRFGVVDVPGHERFIKSMVAGAGGIDVVLLVIAADEGVMPQTREHLDICGLLGVQRGLVALTKSDLVEPDWLELVSADVQQALAGTFLQQAPVVPCSAQSGQGLGQLTDTLEQLALDVPPRDPTGVVRLPLDRVFSLKGFGTIVTGTLLSGTLSAGQEVEVLPSASRGTVRRIQVHGEDVPRAVAGQRTAVNLGGVERGDVARGEVLALAGSLKPSALVDVLLELLPSARKSLPARSKFIFQLGTRQQEAACTLLAAGPLRPGQRMLAQLSFERPVVALPHDRFIARGYAKQQNYGTTIGGGEIVRVQAPRLRRRDSDGIAVLQQMLRADRCDRLSLEVLCAGTTGLARATLQQHLPFAPAELESLLSQLLARNELVRFDKEREVLIHRDCLATLEQRLLALVAEHHERHPLERGIGREELRSRLGAAVSSRLHFATLMRLQQRGALTVDRELCWLPTHRARASESLEQLVEQLRQTYLEAALAPPREEELPGRTDSRAAAIAEALKLLVQRAELVRVSSLLFAAEPLADLERRLRELFAERHEISAADFKALVGQSRKFAIPLAEYFDKKRVTIRIGDVRRLRV